MNQNEFQIFFKSACIAFPGLREWLQDKSPDPPLTLSVWARTLSQISADEALAVLDGWIDGSILEPPTGFKRETFALQVRAVALSNRKVVNAELARQETFRREYRSGLHSKTGIQLGRAYLRMKAEVDRKDAGEFDQWELDRRLSRIQDEAFKEMQVMK